MLTKLLLTALLAFQFCNGFSQIGDTITIVLSDNQAIYKQVEKRATDETNLLKKYVSLDSIMYARTKSNLYTLNQRFFENMKHVNYKLEKLLLQEYHTIKKDKDAFLKLFLKEKDYKKYLKLVASVAQEDRKKYKALPPHSDPNINALREETLGWDLLQQTIIFKD